MSQVSSVAWYRFRATLRERWSGYLSLIVVIGLLGGLSMGALAAARRTQSSFGTFLASTNPSQLRLGTDLYEPAIGSNVGYSAGMVHEIARMAHVRRVESAVLLNAVPYFSASGKIGADGEPAAGDPTNLNTIGSLDGEYFNMDRVTITRGHMANPKDPYQVVAQASQAQGIRVGESSRLGCTPTPKRTLPVSPRLRSLTGESW